MQTSSEGKYASYLYEQNLPFGGLKLQFLFVEI